MSRFLIVFPFVAVAPVGTCSAALPPVPRVIIPAGALPKVDEAKPDEPTPDSSENPATTAERIAKNAKAISDRLGEKDTGADTRSGQEKLKKDIDSLIKALENPPPMSNQNSPMNNQQSGGGGGGQQPQPQGQSRSSGQSRGNRSQGGGAPGANSGGGQQPRNSSGRQPQPGERGQQPGQDEKSGQSKQQQNGEKPQSAGAKPDGGGKAQPAQAGGQPGGGGVATPSLPLDEAIARDFWGNLPELPRQRMLQFFREQYMSRYKELLPQYYQSLAEKDKKAKK
jgi:hypothetical protein